jgi:outer membrane receptor protein involved in Fe transport
VVFAPSTAPCTTKATITIKSCLKDKTVSEGNPNLKPTLSNNLDLLGEYYTGGTGLISAGIFAKNITSYSIIKKDDVRFSEVERYVTTPEELVDEGALPATITDYKKYYDPLKAKDDILARTKPMNAGVANLVGVEIGFQRKLSFLPGILEFECVCQLYTQLDFYKERRTTTARYGQQCPESVTCI